MHAWTLATRLRSASYYSGAPARRVFCASAGQLRGELVWQPSRNTKLCTPMIAAFSHVTPRPARNAVAALTLLASSALLLAGINPDPFTSEKLQAIDTAILACIATNGTPGGVFWLERNGHEYHRAYGFRALIP